MQSSRALYSDFFTSGLSNISDSTNFHRPTYYGASVLPLSSAQQPKSRKRHTIMTSIPNVLNLPISSSTSSKENKCSSVKTHRRVSSLLPSPSRKWFDTISRRASIRRSSTSHSMKIAALSERPDTPDTRNTVRGVFRRRDCPDRSSDAPASDPFSSFPGSASYFIDMQSGSYGEPHRPQPDSVSPIPTSRLSIDFVSCRLPRKFRSQERPTSIQTMPALHIPRSQRSSLLLWSTSISDSSEKSDNSSLCIWQEDDGPLSPLLAMENDDSANIDWREFHDLLPNTDIESD